MQKRKYLTEDGIILTHNPDYIEPHSMDTEGMIRRAKECKERLKAEAARVMGTTRMRLTQSELFFRDAETHEEIKAAGTVNISDGPLVVKRLEECLDRLKAEGVEPFQIWCRTKLSLRQGGQGGAWTIHDYAPDPILFSQLEIYFPETDLI